MSDYFTEHYPTNIRYPRFDPHPELDWPVIQKGSLARLIDVFGQRNVLEYFGTSPENKSLAHLNNLFLLSQIVLKTTLLEYAYRTDNPHGSKYDKSLLKIANYLPKLIAEKRYQTTDLREITTDLDTLLANFEIPREFAEIFSSPDGSQSYQALTLTERVIQLLWQVSPIPTINPNIDINVYKQIVETQLRKIAILTNNTLNNIRQNTLPITHKDNYRQFTDNPYMQALRQKWRAERMKPENRNKRQEEALQNALARQIRSNKLNKQEKQRARDKKFYEERKREYKREMKKHLQERVKFLKEQMPNLRDIKDISTKLASIGEIKLLTNILASVYSAKELQRLAQTFHNYCAATIDTRPVRLHNYSKNDSMAFISRLIQSLWRHRGMDSSLLLNDLANACYIELDLAHRYNPQIESVEDNIAAKLAQHNEFLRSNKQEFSDLEKAGIDYLGLPTS